ncbi:MAG: phosphopentomutase [Desulfuromonadales bacterium]|nr:phosphopentomutase [Desulfuromonadales bacterium]
MSNKHGRAILIVLDGVGLGALPDAAAYGDEGAATLPHVAAAVKGLTLPNMQALGLGSLAEITGVAPVSKPGGGYGALLEASAGKDSIVGHWELAGLIKETPFTTYPNGFPEELVGRFSEIAGVKPLGNVPAGGLSILRQFGAEHVRTKRPILYTSVDSVFQIAAHEEVVPLQELYELCIKARKLVDDYNIGRVIARPFQGSETSGFRRTSRRKDFSMLPPQATLLDELAAAGLTVSAVGKIHDLFAGRGVTQSVASDGNVDGMTKTLNALAQVDEGLVMVNLIDFDMAYGHRNDVVGFAAALEQFDAWLPQLYDAMRPDDLLMITADHGCDPTLPGTDHTREAAPLLCYSKQLAAGVNLGVRPTFADVGATLAEFFAVSGADLGGASFLAALKS